MFKLITHLRFGLLLSKHCCFKPNYQICVNYDGWMLYREYRRNIRWDCLL